MSEERPVILFGGSFNPFHNAHLAMALAVHDFLPQAQLVLVPAGSPPHKSGQPLLPFEHRRAMLEDMARALGSWASVSDIENRRAGPTYTVETIARFKDDFAGPLYFLIGGDSLRDLPKWRRYRELVAQVQLLIIERPGYDSSRALDELAAELDVETIATLRRHIVAMPPHDLSSTDIREQLRAGRSIEELVPSPVLRYLQDHALLEPLIRSQLS